MDYTVIDSDGHVMEPPDLWEKRMPTALRDRAPRMHQDRKSVV